VRVPGWLLAVVVGEYALIVGFGDRPPAMIGRIALLGVLLSVVGGRRAAALCTVLLVLVVGSRFAGPVLAAGTGVLVSVAVVAVVRRVLRRGVNDWSAVTGALLVYLLLALLFSAVHQLLAGVLGQPYLSESGDPASYLYFSVVTLTTVGFGDITPASSAARAVAMTEALVGQLYLVAVVGSVVGRWRRPDRPEP
jgi:hypothetical protein